MKVLVVDDSAFARKVVRELLEREPGIEVVGIARDGLEALEKAAELRPDVITLDLVMPHLDGIGLLRALPKPGPRVVVVSITEPSSDLALLALELGAFDLVTKPTALATERLYQLGDDLVRKVRAAAAATPERPSAPGPFAAPRMPATGRVSLLALGASTGGPAALSRLLAALPADLPCPIAIVVHLPAEYTASFARRLDDACQLTVRHAAEGMALTPGLAVLARGGLHLRVARSGMHLVPDPLGLHVPSVDALFESAAAAYGSGVLGVVLTGMGNDGLVGARAIKASGGSILTEAEESCVVYGMPRVVKEAHLSDGEHVLADLPAAILARM